LPYDFTVLGKRSFLAVKISLKRGCFGEGWEGEFGDLVDFGEGIMVVKWEKGEKYGGEGAAV